jgi:hypothetical protein
MPELTDKIVISREVEDTGGGTLTSFTVQDLINLLDTLYEPIA